MSLNLFWFLPTHGDGHYLGSDAGARPVDHGYLQQIAQAADRLGFTGVLIPTGRSCEDAWLVAASMIPVTRQSGGSRAHGTLRHPPACHCA